jgi:hypothetical protein
MRSRAIAIYWSPADNYLCPCYAPLSQQIKKKVELFTVEEYIAHVNALYLNKKN